MVGMGALKTTGFGVCFHISQWPFVPLSEVFAFFCTCTASGVHFGLGSMMLFRADTHKLDVLQFCRQRAVESAEDVNMMDRESASLVWRLLELLVKQNGVGELRWLVVRWLLSYHRRLTMISQALELRVEGGRVSHSGRVCVVSQGNGGFGDGGGGWDACWTKPGVGRMLGDAGALPECEAIH